jgi:hypothetical protein
MFEYYSARLAAYFISYSLIHTNFPNHKVLMALFDSGGTIILMHECILMTEVTPFISINQIFTTLAGDFQSNKQVLLQDIVLPEFKRTAYSKPCMPSINWSMCI